MSTTYAKTQFLNDYGTDVIQLVNTGGGVQFGISTLGGLQITPALLAVNSAIPAHTAGNYAITKGSAGAYTISAPTAGIDDGNVITILATTSFAHTLTAPAGTFVVGGSALNTVLTVTAANGAGTQIILTAYNGKWYVTTGGYGVITVS